MSLLCPRAHGQDLDARIAARIAQAPAQAVGVYFRDLTTKDSVLINARLRFHAASTMKVPVMIQLFRDRDAGRLSLDDSIAVTNTFRSIMDTSTYQLDRADDSDSSLYARVGTRASIRELVELMETVSSNLATNLLIAKEGIPAGLPARVRVYHKTGWIGKVVYHDGCDRRALRRAALRAGGAHRRHREGRGCSRARERHFADDLRGDRAAVAGRAASRPAATADPGP